MSEQISTIRRMRLAALTAMHAVRGVALGGLARLARETRTVRPSARVRPARRVRQVSSPRWGLAALRRRLVRRVWPPRAPEARRGGAGGGPARGAGWRSTQSLRAMPRQIVPASEAVDLTPAERAAFAGLMRQFSDGRR
jgi:hypothetical protein